MPLQSINIYHHFRRFKYHLCIYSAEELIENDNEKILTRLEESFQRVHSNRYQSKLLFKLYPWSICRMMEFDAVFKQFFSCHRMNIVFFEFDLESERYLILNLFSRYIIMNTCVESLPNELFIEVFQYLDARDIFRAFYQLNSRFHALLQSLRDLYMILATSDIQRRMYAGVDPKWVCTMTLLGTVNIKFEKLLQSSPSEIRQSYI